MRARVTEPGNSNSQPQPAEQPASQPARAPLPEKQRRGRSRAVRELSRSPTPGSTDHELEPEDSAESSEYAYTHVTHVY